MTLSNIRSGYSARRQRASIGDDEPPKSILVRVNPLLHAEINSLADRLNCSKNMVCVAALKDAVAYAKQRKDDTMMSERVESEIIDAAVQFRRRLDEIANNLDRPSVRYRPSIAPDGNCWIALYGEHLSAGVVGVGDSPEEAMRDFDVRWYKKVEKQ